MEKITRTGENLVLDEAEIEKLTVEKLNEQLDFHCKHENHPEYHSSSREKVPKKSTIGSQAARVLVLKAAVAHYLIHIKQTGPPSTKIVPTKVAEMDLRGEEHLEDDSGLYFLDYEDDLA
ncbi:hypothetical protein C0993_010925 [Termitomyces sp. T159_Od127]|nr:hypothetical protein C0993_010925 [Termitomyces sp. T159_Od127]